MNSQPEALPRRTLLKGAVALGGVAALSACGQNSPATTKPRGITVTDQRGKKLVLDGPAKRIVTIPFPAASIVVAVDRTAEHLAGMNEASWTAVRDGTLGQFFPDAIGIKHNVAAEDFSPNVESILALKPDVVVQWATQGDGILTPLENAGLPVLGVNYGKLADVNEWLSMFSTMLGKPERGEAMNARMAENNKAIAARTEKRGAKAPSILYFLRFAESLTVTGAGSFNDEYIKLVGGTNAAADIAAPNQEVDLEQVLSWDPEIILLGNFDPAVPADLYGDKRWKDVAAVKSKRVYKVPMGGYRWDPPSHESPLMWSWLSSVAFPADTGLDIRAQIVDDYDFLYGKKPSATQIDAILQLEPNAQSADYRQFSAP